MQDMSLPGSVDARSRNDDGGRLAPRFIGAFAHETRILWGSWRGLTVLGRVLCGCVAWAMCAGAARVRPDGEARALADLWGYCGYTMLVRGV